jgi:peroxiredoxin Q/BCP
MLQLVRNGFRVLTGSLLSALLLASPLAAALEVGDKAPDFSLQGSDGETYTLSQFLGEKPVVIAFFPKAFTGG